MTDLQSLVALTYDGLVDLLVGLPEETWDAPSLCDNWQVRHVVAHMIMPVRFTPEQFAVEMAAVKDFNVFSNTVAARDACLPIIELLDALGSKTLHAWQPGIGGAIGALSHAVIHSLDITLALDCPSTAPIEAVISVLEYLVGANGTIFGVELDGVQLRALDIDWTWGTGRSVNATSNELVALLSGRTLPNGHALERVG